MTVEEFARMETADTEVYELVDGELIPLPSGTAIHAAIRDLTGDRLRSYFRRNPVGFAYAEVDCRLAEDEVRRPDVAVFLKERLNRIDRYRSPLGLAPDIAIEILSPSETAMAVRAKVRDYLRGGCQEVRILDYSNTEAQVHSVFGIRVLQSTDFPESPLLPGFAVSVQDLLTAV